MKNSILLIAGAVITLLFLVLNTKIFEALFFERQFSNEMYNQNLYFVVALITVLVAWGLAAVFYYVVNSVSFSRWYHWLCMLAIVTVAVPVVCYIYNNAIFGENNLQYTQESIVFELQNLLFAPIMFIIASFSMRWWSSNCRHTPIPQ